MGHYSTPIPLCLNQRLKRYSQQVDSYSTFQVHEVQIFCWHLRSAQLPTKNLVPSKREALYKRISQPYIVCCAGGVGFALGF